VDAVTQQHAGRAIARARATRRRVANAPGRVPLALTLIAGTVLAGSFAAVSFGFLSATLAHHRRPVAQAAPVTPPPEIVKPAALEQRAAVLRRQLDAEVHASTRVDRTIQKVQARIASLDQTRAEMLSAVDQRRSELAKAEDAARHSAEDQQKAAARRQELQQEAARLQDRIAELNASIGEAEQEAAASLAKAGKGPQLVECLRNAVVLRPQQVRIPLALVNNGTLAAAVRRRGAHFIVAPDGFDSFMLARGVARGTGTLVIAEPRGKE
jgi:prefoldin subunit 5